MNFSIKNIKKILYIGATGKLNEPIHRLLEVKGFSVDIMSARKPSKIYADLYDLVVLGGRDIAPILPEIELLKSKKNVVYISTFVGNEFYDSYQLGKKREVQKLKAVCKYLTSIDVPFIQEILPTNVSKLIENRRTNMSEYFLASTSFEHICNSIVKAMCGESSSLQFNKIYIHLSSRDKLLWSIFSKLYQINTVIRLQSYLKFIKGLEKVAHKLLRASNLSCVFIQRCRN